MLVPNLIANAGLAKTQLGDQTGNETGSGHQAEEQHRASVAKLLAATSVMSRLVILGRKLSGSRQIRRISASFSSWKNSASSSVNFSVGRPVNWVCTRICNLSQTTKICGLLNALLQFRNCQSAASRFLPEALFSHAKRRV